jgi:chlorite dismutase
MTVPPIAQPPETLEGWYALHQILRFARQKPEAASIARMVKSAASAIGSPQQPRNTKAVAPPVGWSRFVRLIGSTSDVMVIHFRESLDAIGAAQDALAKTQLGKSVQPGYSFLSVAEAGLYHITAEMARAAAARGGQVGDAEYAKARDPGEDAVRLLLPHVEATRCVAELVHADSR